MKICFKNKCSLFALKIKILYFTLILFINKIKDFIFIFIAAANLANLIAIKL